ncbi:MAG: hypothetical protein JXR03_19440 [Cyclobacteriaceae bacterium]
MTLLEEVSNMKRDVEIVDAMGVYSFTSKSYLHKDDNFGSTSFIETMCDCMCFDTTKFLYLDFKDMKFFVQVSEEKAAIVKLKNGSNYNKVILELACSKFLNGLY